MKVGILTYHWANNYGAVVQAYALLEKLKDMGHDAFVIDRIRTFSSWRWLYHGYSYKHHYSWNKFQKFNKNHLVPKTPLYKSSKQLADDFANQHFDAVIVGSDQVWRETFMGHDYFLDFVSGNCKKVSYAASFGLSKWTNGENFTAKARVLLRQFDAISVREKTGVDICKKVFGVEAQLVIDPTLLWDASFYETKLLVSSNEAELPLVASYILGVNPEQQKIAKKMAEEEGLDYVNLWGLKSFVQGHYTVVEWLQHIHDAKYIVTNSFHATVFSILFHKHFVVLNNKSGGSDRIVTLLKTLGLQRLFVDSLDEVRQMLKQPIDYQQVDEKISLLRINSLNFLNSIL